MSTAQHSARTGHGGHDSCKLARLAGARLAVQSIIVIVVAAQPDTLKASARPSDPRLGA